MAFQGGPLSLIGISPEFLTGLGTTTSSSGVAQATGQIWKGSGQNFFGSAGQGIAGGLAGSAVNIALNSAFGTDVVGPQGLSLDSGSNLLASAITPQVTGAVSAGINQQIQQSLQKAGPFGSLLSNIGTGLVNQAFNGLTNSIFGASSAGTKENYKMFPGGGKDGETPADYSGVAYTLTDVVFSIQPANQGPQAFGSTASSKTMTTLPWGDLTGSNFGVDYGGVNEFKGAVMKGNFLGDVVSTDTGLA